MSSHVMVRLRTGTLNENLDLATNVVLVDLSLKALLPLFQLEKPALFLTRAHVVIEPGGRSTRTLRIFEDIEPVVSDLLNQLQRFAKICFGLTRKADNNITGYGHPASRILDGADTAE